MRHILLACLCASIAQAQPQSLEDISVAPTETSRRFEMPGGRNINRLTVTASSLTVQGDLTAQSIRLTNGANLTIAGTLNVNGEVVLTDSFLLVRNRLDPQRNIVVSMTLNGRSTIDTYGFWRINKFTLNDRSTLVITPYLNGRDYSGSLILNTVETFIGERATIDASAAGNHPEGFGMNTTWGGSYGGRGGGHPDDVDLTRPLYGTRFDEFRNEQGSRGGEYGGGGVYIFSEELTMDGSVHADGKAASTLFETSAGSGGGVNFITDTIHSFDGIVTARGGIGSSTHGAGGGGRIKVTAINQLPALTQFDASAGRTFNPEHLPATDGTIWLNYSPSLPTGLERAYRFPADSRPAFPITVHDRGNAHDIVESLTLHIQVWHGDYTLFDSYAQSSDPEVFDAEASVSGDTVIFQFPEPLPMGDYWIKARVQDQSHAYGPSTDFILLSVGMPETPALQSRLVPEGVEISFLQPIQHTFELQWSANGISWFLYDWIDAEPNRTEDVLRKIVVVPSPERPHRMFRLVRQVDR